MWALICDTEDGELRVVGESIARDEYMNTHKSANRYTGNWELRATAANKEPLLRLARLTDGREEELDCAICFLRS